MAEKNLNLINKLLKVSEQDYIDIGSEEESCLIDEKDRLKQVSDFCLYNGCRAFTKLLKKYGSYVLKDTEKYNELKSFAVVNSNGKLKVAKINDNSIGVAPIINIELPIKTDIKKYKNNFSLFKGLFSSIKRKPIISLGNYPQKLVDFDTITFFEEMISSKYNKSVKSTGKFYLINGSKRKDSGFLTKLCPEYYYNGKRYVRYETGNNEYFLNDQIRAYNGVLWFEVKPIKFIIKNWDKMPKYINFNGDGTARSMILESRDIILSKIPFVKNNFENITNYNWETSFLRKYINSEKIVNELFVSEAEQNLDIIIPNDETEIVDYAFSGCSGLNSVIMHSGVEKVGANAFKNCGFKYFCTIDDGSIVLANELPKNVKVENLVNYEEISNYLKGVTINDILNKYLNKSYNDLSYINKFVSGLKKANFICSYDFVKKFDSDSALGKIVDFDFRFLKNELPNLADLLDSRSASYINSFYLFANILGCFSRERVKDKNGKNTDVLVGQKASTFLGNIIKDDILSADDIAVYLSDIHYNVNETKPNDDLLKFLSTKGENGQYINLMLLVNMEYQEAGSFSSALENFGVAKCMRKQVDKNGKIHVLSWEEAFRKARFCISYENIDEYNYKLADVFAKNGMTQQLFNIARNTYEKARKDNIQTHILNKPLKEKSYLEQIEILKDQTRENLEDSKNILESIFNNDFTYEFLDKSDPRNAIIGNYCDCCAIIGGVLYGSEIAKATILAPDVQNLVIKDKNDEIIAKAALYVNKEIGYVVLNEFELNEKFKKHQIGNTGYYNDAEDSKAYKNREQIFDAFMRGIKDFVKEYDKENPNKPIQKVNVGFGYNRLKLQCERFKEDVENLHVPFDYGFEDATSDKQYVLYDREEELAKQKEKELKL